MSDQGQSPSFSYRWVLYGLAVAGALAALFITQQGGVQERGEPLGRLRFGRLHGADRPTQTLPLAIAADTRLTFTVLLSRYQTNRGRRSDLMFRIEALHDGEPIAMRPCRGYRIRGSSGGGGIVGTENDCGLTVPAPGADAIRITAHFNDGQVEMLVEGLSVEVHGAQ